MKQWCAIALAVACVAVPAVAGPTQPDAVLAAPAGSGTGAEIRPTAQGPSARTVKVGDRPVYPDFTFRRIGVPDAVAPTTTFSMSSIPFR